MEDPKTDMINDINYFYKIFFDPYCFQHMIFLGLATNPPMPLTLCQDYSLQ